MEPQPAQPRRKVCFCARCHGFKSLSISVWYRHNPVKAAKSAVSGAAKAVKHVFHTRRKRKQPQPQVPSSPSPPPAPPSDDASSAHRSQAGSVHRGKRPRVEIEDVEDIDGFVVSSAAFHAGSLALTLVEDPAAHSISSEQRFPSCEPKAAGLTFPRTGRCHPRGRRR